jgi:hypothetical protein
MSSTYPSPSALSPSTVSNSSVQVAAANLQRAGLYVFNPSATITIWVSPTGTVAAVNGTGSVAIQPYQGVASGTLYFDQHGQNLSSAPGSIPTNGDFSTWITPL